MSKEIMGEVVRLFIVAAFGSVMSWLNINDSSLSIAGKIIGLLVGVATLIFIIFQIVHIWRCTKVKGLEYKERKEKWDKTHHP